MSDTNEVLALLGWAVRHSWDDHHNEDGDGIRALVQRARNQHDAERATIAALKADLARHKRALAAEKERADNAALGLARAAENATDDFRKRIEMVRDGKALYAEAVRVAEENAVLRSELRDARAWVSGGETWEAVSSRWRAALAAGPAALRAMAESYDRKVIDGKVVGYHSREAGIIRSADLINAALHVEAAQLRAMEEG